MPEEVRRTEVTVKTFILHEKIGDTVSLVAIIRVYLPTDGWEGTESELGGMEHFERRLYGRIWKSSTSDWLGLDTPWYKLTYTRPFGRQHELKEETIGLGSRPDWGLQKLFDLTVPQAMKLAKELARARKYRHRWYIYKPMSRSDNYIGGDVTFRGPDDSLIPA